MDLIGCGAAGSSSAATKVSVTRLHPANTIRLAAASPSHGARLARDDDYELSPRYSSADEDNYFGWRHMRPKTPLILARRFIVEFPKFAAQGKHPDPDYVGWFTKMLELTAPIGVVSAFGDMCSPDDGTITEFCEDGVVVPLPPVWGGM